MERTDNELVALARSGDKRAFEQLIERHNAAIRRAAFRMVQNEEVARELAHEAMLQAYLSLDRLREGTQFAAWLHGIVVNFGRRYLREQKHGLLSLESLEREPIAASPDPERVAEQREQKERVRAAVQSLSPPNRDAARLFYFEQLSLREVADALGISVGAVKGRLFQCRKQLREPLLALYPEEAGRSARELRRKMIQVHPIHVSDPDDPSASRWDAQLYLLRIILSSGYLPSGYRGNLVCLMEEGGDRVLPLSVGAEARVIDAAVAGDRTAGSSDRPLIASLLTATGSQIADVRIEALKDEILHAVVRLRQGKKEREVAARLGEAMALAVQTGTPIFVTEAIMDSWSWDLSDARVIAERIRQTESQEALRRAAAEPLIARVAQGILEYGLRHIQMKNGCRPAELVLEPRRNYEWQYVWMVCRYGEGSEGAGNVPMPLETLPVLIARFKEMANLPIMDRENFHEGRTSFQQTGKTYELTVSTAPTPLGEKLSLRLEPAGLQSAECVAS